MAVVFETYRTFHGHAVLQEKMAERRALLAAFAMVDARVGISAFSVLLGSSGGRPARGARGLRSAPGALVAAGVLPAVVAA